MIICPICKTEMGYYFIDLNSPQSDIYGECLICNIKAFYKFSAPALDKYYQLDNKNYSENEIIRVFKQKAFL
jgi:hypothetical protein